MTYTGTSPTRAASTQRSLKGIRGFRLRKRCVPDDAPAQTTLARPDVNVAALTQLTERLHLLAEGFFDMSEDDFGEWLNAMPRDEFFEYIRLGAQGVGEIIQGARDRAIRAKRVTAKQAAKGSDA